MRIREFEVQNNQQGRVGCQFQSPFTNQIYYVSIEHGAVVLRDWGKVERGREGNVGVVPLDLSACFAQPGLVCVTVGGFTAGSENSRMETYTIPLAE
jgi:hypothetical protein